MLAKYIYSKKNIILPIIILLFVAVSLFIINIFIKEGFEYDVDEGVELMKATLFSKGFLLYKDIFGDHPPLFTVILSVLIKLSGATAYYARIMVLVFSTILLWALFGILKKESDKKTAIIAVFLLVFSNFYIPLSASVMIGLPSLSLAMVSIYCIWLYRKHHLKRFLYFSGVLFALSLHVKLFTLVILPIILLEIIRYEKRSAIYWIFGLVSAWVTIFLIFFHFNFLDFFYQLINPHLQILKLPGCDFRLIYNIMATDYDLLLLGFIGTAVILRQKKTPFPIFWILCVLAAIFFHSPIWYHHYLLVSIPLAWLAAIAVGDAINRKRGFYHYFVLILVLLSALRLPFKYGRIFDYIEAGKAEREPELVELLRSYKSKVNWIFTDRPIYAFYAGIPTPPELTLVVQKRNFIETKNEAYLIKNLEKYKPELILLGRADNFSIFGPGFSDYLEKKYFNIYKTSVLERKIVYSGNNWESRYVYPAAKKTVIFVEEIVLRIEKFFFVIKEKFIYEPQRNRCKLAFDFLLNDLDRLILLYAQWGKEGFSPSDSMMNSAFAIPAYGSIAIKPYEELPYSWLSGEQLDKLKVANPRNFSYNLLRDIFNKWQSRYQAMVSIYDEADVYKTIISDLESIKSLIIVERDEYNIKFVYKLRNGNSFNECTINSINLDNDQRTADEINHNNIKLYLRNDNVLIK